MDSERWQSRDSCPACTSQDLHVFYEVADAPVESCLLLSNRAEAEAVLRRPIQLCFCNECGFIFNRSHDAAAKLPTTSYFETQSYSPYFRNFSEQLSLSLIEDYGLRGKTVLEIGSGTGEFLAQICTQGNNRGIGFEPAFENDDLPTADNRGRVQIIKDFFSERHAGVDADFIVCRHTLEHIPAVRDFLCPVRRVAEKDTQPIVFFEVPDSLRILRETAFWDIYYEHCSYFTKYSLGRLFSSMGFEVLRIRYAFEGQYLLLECRAANGEAAETFAQEGTLQEIRDEVARFKDSVERQRDNWRSLVRSRTSSGRPAVIWGSTAKASAFLVALGLEAEVECIVNINPLHQGRFVAGTGHEVVAPESLMAYQPGLVVSMNHVYQSEIEDTLDRMGVQTQVLSVQGGGFEGDASKPSATKRSTKQ